MLLRLLGSGWCEIDAQPFDCEIEVAIIGGDISVPGGSYLRHDRSTRCARPVLPKNCPPRRFDPKAE